MRNTLQIFLSLLIAAMFFGDTQGFCKSNQARSNSYPNTAISSAFVNVDVAQNLAEDFSNVKLSINIDKPALVIQEETRNCHLDGEGIIGGVGYPDLPAIVRWIRVPEKGRINFTYDVTETSHFSGDAPRNYFDLGEDGKVISHPDPPQLTGLYPPQVATISAPVIMRGVRMVKMTVYPIQWDEDNGQYIQNFGIKAEVNVSEGRGTNEVQEIVRRPSRDFDRLLDGLLVNPPQRDNPDGFYKPGGYVVVMDETAPEEVFEFIDWKRQAGHDVYIIRVNSQMTAVDIREEAARLYREEGIEFLVFMGSNYAESPLFMPMDDTWADMYYAHLDGADFVPDIAVGSFNCLTEDNLICAIRRAISYQSDPFMENTAWFTRGGVGVGACSVPQDLCPSYTGKWIAEVLERNGFDDVQTSFYADNEIDDPSRMIEELYNQNANFIIVRAHEWNLEVDNIQPGPVYPFHFLVSSGTISPPDDGAFNWAFRQGTADQLKGPSAGFGHHSSPRTNDANALVGSMIQALFFLDVESYGWARNYALLNLQRLMVEDGDDRYRMESYRWRYYGDPSQWCWRGVPIPLAVECPESIPVDGNDFSVIVTDNNGEPVENALVSMTQVTGFKATALTDEDGRAYLTWLYEQDVLDPDLPINVTATADGHISESVEVEVEDHNWWVVIRGQVFVDQENGNNDEMLNPGERGLLYLQLGNPGDVASPAIQSIRLTSDSPWLEVGDAEFQCNPINSNSIIQLENGFVVDVLPGCPNDETLVFQVTFLTAGDVSITSGFQMNAHSPQMVFESADNILEQGFESELLLTLRNNGDVICDAVNATLETLSPFIQIGQNNGVFPACLAQDRVEQLGEGDGQAFTVTPLESVVSGMDAEFRLILRNENFIDTLLFTMPVGFALEGDPLGPDEYGYVVFDDIDQANDWGEPPEYEWLEINPQVDIYLFEGEILPLPNEEEPDVTNLVQMPFPFRYYGNEYTEISVCSNGWFAVGDQTTLVNQQNWDMPGINGAYGMIAVLWDRLRYENPQDGIYTFYDEEGGRFIIQWQTSVEDNQQNSPNVFEAIIYDPYAHPSITWDSMIQFQYNTVNNVQDEWEANAHCTVGISSPSGLDGLTYTYWNQYDPAAVELGDGRALLWKTISYDVPATIFGNVTRWIDGAPVELAVITSSDGMVTRYVKNGEYRLVNVTPGDLDVEVVAEGYGIHVAENINVEEHADVEQNFVLSHGWLDIDPDTLVIGYTVMPDSDYASSVIFNLLNVGNLPCDVMLDSFDPLPEFLTWSINVQDDGFVIDAGGSQEIEISYNAVGSEAGRYEGTIYFTNNSPVDTFKVPVVFDVAVGIDPQSGLFPLKLELKKPYPNPFNSVATVEFDMPKAAQINLALYNIDGRLIQTIVDGSLEAGTHAYSISAGDLASGVYFVKLTTGERSMAQRLLLIR